MLLKRILAGVLCAVITAGCIYYGVTFRFFDRVLSVKAQEEFKQAISLPDNFTLAASVNCSESAKNSLQAVRDAVRSGAFAIELNVSFNAKNVPYLADGPEYITKESVPLSKVFEENVDQASLRYLLNMGNLASPEKLQALIRKYDLTRRVILCGFTPETAREHRKDYAAFLRCTDVSGTGVNLTTSENCRKLIARCVNAGIGYMRCTANDVTPELSQTIRSGTIRLIIDNVHTDYEMYYALSLNPKIVITGRPAELYELLYTNEYLRSEMEKPF